MRIEWVKKHFSNKKDFFEALLWGMLITIAAAYVFYKEYWGIIPGVVAGVYVFRFVSKRQSEKKKNRLLEEFKDLLTSMESILESGSSLERALILSGEELRKLRGDGSELANEIEIIEKKMKVNITLEEALREFAEKEDIREIYDFVEVISTIKKTGGNAIQIIKDTVSRIVEGIELKAELEVMVAAKKLEQQVMVFMPAVVILFLRVTSGSFMSPLYQTVMGKIAMTVVLLINIFADSLGKKIVEINT